MNILKSRTGTTHNSISLGVMLGCCLLFFSFHSKAQSGSDSSVVVAKSHVQNGVYGPALSLLNSFLVKQPKNVDALFWKGVALYKQKNYVASEDVFREIFKIHPGYAPAYAEMGNALLEQKKYKVAADFFSTALSLGDTSSLILNCRGLCYYYTDRLELAIKDFERVIKLDPANAFAYNNRGSCRYNNQDIAAASAVDLRLAEKDFNQAIALKPDFQLALRNRGVIRYYMDSLRTSFDDLFTAMLLNEKDEKAHFFLGRVLHKQGKYEQALKYFDKAIALVNYKAEMYVDRGSCKIELLDYKGARADFNQAILMSNDNGLAYFYLARAYAAEDKKTECMEALKSARKAGLFKDGKYYVFIYKDKYFGRYYKDKAFSDMIYEFKFGKK